MAWIGVIDDEVEVCEVLAEALARAGYEVRTFGDASDAREAIARASPGPAALVVDLVMPHLGGHELVEQLRADPRTARVPVVVLTALDLRDEERAALDVARVLDKPVRIEELVAALAQATGS